MKKIPEHEHFEMGKIFGLHQDDDEMGECIITYEETGFSHRWIQPPVACYFITTMDKNGNTNCAPVSMGTAMWGSPPNGKWYFSIAIEGMRQTLKNLNNLKEFVISYYPYSLFYESMITSLPIPYGISEIDVANLNPLPSKFVKPCGISECISNLECKVINQVNISGTVLFVAEVIAVSVQKEVIERDKTIPYEPGIVMTDLLYELSITGTPPRMNFGRMNIDKIYPMPSTIGDENEWIGTYTSWIKSELNRGRINENEANTLIELNEKWLANRDPIENGTVKKELTNMLKEICWRNV